MTALEFARIAFDAGVPGGVVNVVAGPGSVCGSRLVEHPDVAKIAFTGSTEVGRTIAAGAAAGIKRVTLELGGKSPNLVFADADLEAAARAAPSAVFGNAGQDCCARSRILVERSVMERFVGLLGEGVRELRVGDPLLPETQMGPLISEPPSASRWRPTWTTTRPSPCAAARRTGRGSGTRRPCSRPWPTTRARPPRRSSVRWPA